MDPELCKSYPLFGNLVSRIKEKFSDKGASSKVQKAHDQAMHDLTKARSEYLRNKLLHNEVYELLTDLEVAGLENTLTMDERKLRDVLSTTLAYAELPGYLHFCPSATSNSTLFGLTADDVNRHNPVKMHLADLLQVVKPRVEKKLTQKREELYACSDSSNINSGALMTAKVHSLPVQIEEKKKVLERGESFLQEVRQRRDKQFWSYFQKILECLLLLESLIKNFKCGSQAETDVRTVQQLSALCKVTSLKLTSAQLRILCSTYTEETVKGLKSVNGHLETATSQARRELSATGQALHAFRRLGPEFTALATQVTQLQQELLNKKWGLEQFGQRPRNSYAGQRPRNSDTGQTGATLATASLGLADGGGGGYKLPGKDEEAPLTRPPNTSETLLFKSHKFVPAAEVVTPPSVLEMKAAGAVLKPQLNSDNLSSETAASKSLSDAPNAASHHIPDEDLCDALCSLSTSESQDGQPQQAKGHSGKRVTFHPQSSHQE